MYDSPDVVAIHLLTKTHSTKLRLQLRGFCCLSRGTKTPVHQTRIHAQRNLLQDHISLVVGGPGEYCTSTLASLIKTSVGTSGTTRDKIMAAPMACDAAIRALLKDMVIKCLLTTRLIGLTALFALLHLQMVTLVSQACELAHTSSATKLCQQWWFFWRL